MLNFFGEVEDELCFRWYEEGSRLGGEVFGILYIRDFDDFLKYLNN